jgi:pimeloyl-ACP methyl ester carboxylesterase
METLMNTLGAITRRAALAASAGGLTLASTASRAQVRGGAKTYVLVHGAWHGGWCWRRVSDLLEGHGHKVFAPTLTGLGERSHLISRDVNASTHIQDIVNVLSWENLSDVVLVGHSYGGVVISGVAESSADKISSIVFLDAFMPSDGESLVERASATTKGVISAAIEHNDVSIKSPPASAFGVEESDRAWVDSKITPQPIATFTEKASYTGARNRIARKTYMRAKAYSSPTFDANLDRAKADNSWNTYEFDCGHDVMIIQPEHLTEQLLRA